MDLPGNIGFGIKAGEMLRKYGMCPGVLQKIRQWGGEGQRKNMERTDTVKNRKLSNITSMKNYKKNWQRRKKRLRRQAGSF